MRVFQLQVAKIVAAGYATKTCSMRLTCVQEKLLHPAKEDIYKNLLLAN